MPARLIRIFHLGHFYAGCVFLAIGIQQSYKRTVKINFQGTI